MSNSINYIIEQKKLKAFFYLTLMRPANIITAATNILAGIAIAGFINSTSLFSLPVFEIRWINDAFFLIISGSCLYAGGIVLNDVFDINLDKVERPERALPSGKVSIREATVLGSCFILVGLMAAFAVNYYSGGISCLIAIGSVLYNYKFKHNRILGPINMGLCRALNLCLGISILPASFFNNYLYAIIPLLYIVAITLISHGEVKGGNVSSLFLALALYVTIFIAIIYFQTSSVLFVSGWALVVLPPLFVAIRSEDALAQRKAVKLGVLAVILMDASIASGFAGFYYALFITMLLPLSIVVSRKFSVT